MNNRLFIPTESDMYCTSLVLFLDNWWCGFDILKRIMSWNARLSYQWALVFYNSLWNKK